MAPGGIRQLRAQGWQAQVPFLETGVLRPQVGRNRTVSRVSSV